MTTSPTRARMIGQRASELMDLGLQETEALDVAVAEFERQIARAREAGATYPELAAWFGVHRMTVRQWVKVGQRRALYPQWWRPVPVKPIVGGLPPEALDWATVKRRKYREARAEMDAIVRRVTAIRFSPEPAP